MQELISWYENLSGDVAYFSILEASTGRQVDRVDVLDYETGIEATQDMIMARILRHPPGTQLEIRAYGPKGVKKYGSRRITVPAMVSPEHVGGRKADAEALVAVLGTVERLAGRVLAMSEAILQRMNEKDQTIVELARTHAGFSERVLEQRLEAETAAIEEAARAQVLEQELDRAGQGQEPEKTMPEKALELVSKLPTPVQERLVDRAADVIGPHVDTVMRLLDPGEAGQVQGGQGQTSSD